MIDWKLVKKVLLIMKKYQTLPDKVNTKNEVDYNLWLIFHKKIPIEEVGQY